MPMMTKEELYEETMLETVEADGTVSTTTTSQTTSSTMVIDGETVSGEVEVTTTEIEVLATTPLTEPADDGGLVPEIAKSGIGTTGGGDNDPDADPPGGE